MKQLLTLALLGLSCLTAQGQSSIDVKSPDEKLTLTVAIQQGRPTYSVQLDGHVFLGSSPLGLVSSEGDFSKNLRLVKHQIQRVTESYTLTKSKVNQVNYQANQLVCQWINGQQDTLSAIFQVTNRDVAFRYLLHQNGRPAGSNATILKEVTGFKLPNQTTTFLSPQAPALSGWEETKPSYEEEYTRDESIGTPSKYGLGYTFPALFHLGSTGWLLLSETGVDHRYVGTKLSEGTKEGLYTISFPEKEENRGQGAATATATLPMFTSWKTITVGSTLAPIVESTVATDVVKPILESKKSFQVGRATWSWIVWQDPSINYQDQLAFIDLASSMACELVLIDGNWDVEIGRAKIEELVRYAKSKGVEIALWYNSNGNWNKAPQTPKQRMNTVEARREEMAWLQKIGVKSIKVDFFAGDKQTTFQLYHDILTDATEFGLSVNFHGTTLPRGWERMYPSFATSEAVLASENLVFQQEFADQYGVTATLYPFTRNAVASMDFGPVFLNKRLDRTQEKGTLRRTTDAFEMATAVVFFSSIQHWGLTPNNLQEAPPFLLDYLRAIPTVWDETRFVDGYPGQYCVLARRKGETWYVAALNGTSQEKIMTMRLPFLKEKNHRIILDETGQKAKLEEISIDERQEITVRLAPLGGAVVIGK